MALNCSVVNLTPCKTRFDIHCSQIIKNNFIISSKNNGYALLNISEPLIVYPKELFCFAWISFCTIVCLFPTWNLSKKFSWTGRSLWERRTSLADTIVVKLLKSVDSEWISAGNVFQHLHSEQNQVELHITLPSLTDPTSHLHSDQTSWATKWKQNRVMKGQKGNFLFRYMLSRWR